MIISSRRLEKLRGYRFRGDPKDLKDLSDLRDLNDLNDI